MIKTTRERFTAVEQAIREMHTYSVPEILAIPVIAGSAAYLQWLEEQVGDVPPKRAVYLRLFSSQPCRSP